MRPRLPERKYVDLFGMFADHDGLVACNAGSLAYAECLLPDICIDLLDGGGPFMVHKSGTWDVVFLFKRGADVTEIREWHRKQQFTGPLVWLDDYKIEDEEDEEDSSTASPRLSFFHTSFACSSLKQQPSLTDLWG